MSVAQGERVGTEGFVSVELESCALQICQWALVK